MTQARVIEVACASDEAYAPHAATLIHSLARVHGRNRVRVNYLCDASLGTATRATLKGFCRRLGIALRFVDAPSEGFDGLHADERLPRLCWYRSCIDRLCPDLDRVLYLDTDIVIREPLDVLYDTDLGEHRIAAVNDHLAALVFPQVAPRIGIAYERYFNSGMMLLNLRGIRADGGSKVLDIARQHREQLYFPDQDALNLAYADRCLLVSPRWNYPPLTAMYFNMHRDSPMLQQLESCRQIRAPGFRPAVLHFLAHPKPWIAFEPYDYVWDYHRHRAGTPWAPSLEQTARWWMRTHTPWVRSAWRRLRGQPEVA